MPLTLFTSPRFADHLTPPGHPERVERFEVMQGIASAFRTAGGAVREPRAATHDELARVHTSDYIGLIAGTAGRATAIDPDTFTSPDTYEVARLAAGAAVSAVEHVMGLPVPPAVGPARGTEDGHARRAMALVRPPGHHAESDRAMGFCFFNNIAVAAAHARALGVERVAIVDYDVHHGNGTQWAFYTDPSVLFISSHQYPYYPGTGAANEVGTGAGTGFTINLPLAAGGTDGDYELVYSRVAIPALRQYKPELILISAGYDAYMDDPLGGMRLTSECFGRLTAMLVNVADECCGGRVIAITEGGYNLHGLAEGLRETLRALDTASMDGIAVRDGVNASGHEDASHRDPHGRDTARGVAALNVVVPILRQYWQL
jgi:acetoin utilization deacetylase AcuC-like enzyme